jgi:hypothetical protein
MRLARLHSNLLRLLWIKVVGIPTVPTLNYAILLRDYLHTCVFVDHINKTRNKDDRLLGHDAVEAVTPFLDAKMTSHLSTEKHQEL